MFFDNKLFPKTPIFSHVRWSLTSVNKARSFQYGSKFFGNVKRYTDELKVVEKMDSNEDRRKFRFGFKSVVDFVFWFLLECFSKTGDQTKINLPGYKSGLVSDGSFNDLRAKSNQKKTIQHCWKPYNVAEILRWINSSRNFSPNKKKGGDGDGVVF